MLFSYILYGIYLRALWHLATSLGQLATCFMTFRYMLYDIQLHAVWHFATCFREISNMLCVN